MKGFSKSCGCVGLGLLPKYIHYILDFKTALICACELFGMQLNQFCHNLKIRFCACVIEKNEVLLYKYLYISFEIILVYAWAYLGIV